MRLLLSLGLGSRWGGCKETRQINEDRRKQISQRRLSCTACSVVEDINCLFCRSYFVAFSCFVVLFMIQLCNRNTLLPCMWLVEKSAVPAKIEHGIFVVHELSYSSFHCASGRMANTVVGVRTGAYWMVSKCNGKVPR